MNKITYYSCRPVFVNSGRRTVNFVTYIGNTRCKYLNPSGDVLYRKDRFLQMTYNDEYYTMTPFIILRNGLAEAGRRVMFVFW